MNPQLFKRILLNLQNLKAEIDPLFLPTIPTNPVRNQKYDIAIITASIDEYHSFSSFLERIEYKEYSNDPKVHLRGYITNEVGETLSVIMPIPTEMGVAAASISTTKSIINFSPRFLFMVGICAGMKSITNVGDIIVAEKTIDYNEVVEIENSDHSIRTKYMNNVLDIPANIKSKCLIFSKLYRFPNEYIKDYFGYPSSSKCHFGLLATSSSLLRNGERVKQLNKDYHNLKGLDMETYGLYKAVDSFENRNGEIQFLSVKAVSDYADNDQPKPLEKDVDRRKIALYSSSAFLYQFIKKMVK